MSWDPTKAHWRDMNALETLSTRYPRANITLRNRWGNAVCGVRVPEAEEEMEFTEISFEEQVEAHKRMDAEWMRKMEEKRLDLRQ